jgi:hypothetical protein
MSTRSAALPVERSYLLKAWLVVAAIVIVAATAIALGLASAGNGAGDGIRRSPVGTVPGTDNHAPLVIDGELCGQCR